MQYSIKKIEHPRVCSGAIRRDFEIAYESCGEGELPPSVHFVHYRSGPRAYKRNVCYVCSKALLSTPRLDVQHRTRLSLVVTMQYSIKKIECGEGELNPHEVAPASS
jgi:hypothetical protein